MKINKSEFFGILNKLPINAYKIDCKNKCNYYIYNGYKYELHTQLGILGYDMGIKNDYYKFKL